MKSSSGGLLLISLLSKISGEVLGSVSFLISKIIVMI